MAVVRLTGDCPAAQLTWAAGFPPGKDGWDGRSPNRGQEDPAGRAVATNVSLKIVRPWSQRRTGQRILRQDNEQARSHHTNKTRFSASTASGYAGLGFPTLAGSHSL